MKYVYHFVDALIMLSLVSAGYLYPEWSGGPFFGVTLYPILRYVLAFHAAKADRSLSFNQVIFGVVDIIGVVGMALSALLIPQFDGGPFWGCLILVAVMLLRPIVEREAR